MSSALRSVQLSLFPLLHSNIVLFICYISRNLNKKKPQKGVGRERKPKISDKTTTVIALWAFWGITDVTNRGAVFVALDDGSFNIVEPEYDLSDIFQDAAAHTRNEFTNLSAYFVSSSFKLSIVNGTIAIGKIRFTRSHVSNMSLSDMLRDGRRAFRKYVQWTFLNLCSTPVRSSYRANSDLHWVSFCNEEKRTELIGGFKISVGVRNTWCTSFLQRQFLKMVAVHEFKIRGW